jgi:hypothetical protein
MSMYQGGLALASMIPIIKFRVMGCKQKRLGDFFKDEIPMSCFHLKVQSVSFDLNQGSKMIIF